MSWLPTHGDPGTGEQSLLFFLPSRRLSPALLSHMLYPSSAAPKIKGSGQNSWVTHLLVPALLAWFKASERGEVCVACPLHLLLVFSGLRAAEQHIMSPPSPPCPDLLHTPCTRSPNLPRAPGHAARHGLNYTRSQVMKK